ncbi:hypothetical protein D3C71_1969660 [compost metagenome]
MLQCQYYYLFNLWILGQTAFDFGQFDPEATDLHLGIITPNIVNLTVVQVTD